MNKRLQKKMLRKYLKSTFGEKTYDYYETLKDNKFYLGLVKKYFKR